MKKSPEQQVQDWNDDHAVGTKVRRYRLIRPRREAAQETETATAAWVMGGHSAVVRLKDFSGAVALEALEVIKGTEGANDGKDL